MSDVVLSSEMLQAMAAQETSEAILVLLTISHTDLTNPIRVTSDTVPTTHLGNTYLVFPFAIDLPTNLENDPPEMRLTIDNVDRSIIETLRTISSAPTVDVAIVRASAPDIVELEYKGFRLYDVTADMLQVSGRLGRPDMIGVRCPKGRFNPSTAPGLFL